MQLDAERSLFLAQLQATINLYKAMGGGWVAQADKLSVPPVATK